MGKFHHLYTYHTLVQLSPVYNIQAMQTKLADCLGSRNEANVHALWNKIDSLELVLHPNFLQNATPAGAAQCSAKEDLLVGYVKQLEMVTNVAQVEELQQLKDYVNTTEFQGLESHEKQLAGVVGRHAEQERTVEELAGKVQALLKTYYQIMLQLSAQCVAWDEDLDRRRQSAS